MLGFVGLLELAIYCMDSLCLLEIFLIIESISLQLFDALVALCIVL